jgi:hypothetical protein
MRSLIAFSALAACIAAAKAAEPHRHAGAHQHGQGRLNIAIEGSTVSIGLDVPAADIVGFEHAAKSKAELALVESAKAKLADPLALFETPPAAGCTMQDTKVEIEAAAGNDHRDFNAEYTLICNDIAKLTAIEFRYFSAFKGAQTLEGTLISQNGQAKFTVTRKAPRLDLARPK